MSPLLSRYTGDLVALGRRIHGGVCSRQAFRRLITCKAGVKRSAVTSLLVMRGSKSLLTWIAGVLVAAVIAVLGVIFMMDIYIALQEPERAPIERR